MEIKLTKGWNSDAVREMCMKHGFFTKGTVEEYHKMLNYVDNHSENPEDTQIYAVADNILAHTDENLEMTVENIMFLLANHAIWYSYEVSTDDSFSNVERIMTLATKEMEHSQE